MGAGGVAEGEGGQTHCPDLLTKVSSHVLTPGSNSDRLVEVHINIDQIIPTTRCAQLNNIAEVASIVNH